MCDGPFQKKTSTVLEPVTNGQGQSLFFTKLPFDVPSIIYEFVLSEAQPIHIVSPPFHRKLAYIRCQESRIKSSLKHSCRGFSRYPMHPSMNPIPKSEQELDGVGGLLRACRLLSVISPPFLNRTVPSPSPSSLLSLTLFPPETQKQHQFSIPTKLSTS